MKNIFSIISNNYDLVKEVNRIDKLFNESYRLQFNFQHSTSYEENSIKNYLEGDIFRNWNHRNTALSIYDFLESCGLEQAPTGFELEVSEFFNYLEFYLNMIYIFKKHNSNYRRVQQFVMTRNNIAILLSHFNHKYEVIDIENIKVIIIEDKPEATLAAEIIQDDEISLEIIRYNHFQLKGNLIEKRKILSQLYKEFEKRETTLKHNNLGYVQSDLGSMFNNIGIRHDKASNKVITERVNSMTDEELEIWCDRTYDTFLLVVLLVNYIELKPDIKALNDKTKLVSE